MSLKVGVLMDPLASINIKKDSTFALMLEAQKRGHTVAVFTPHTLSQRASTVTAAASKVTLRHELGNHFTEHETSPTDLSTFDVILMRQDPPFDMAYITATYMLETVQRQGAAVFNDPASVRDCSEKMFALQFAQFQPPTLISRDVAQLRAFHQEHGDMVIKPLYGHGGEGVFHLPKGSPNLKVLVDLYAEKFREPFVAQGYIKEAAVGDKRIILCDGAPIGAVLRVPAQGEHRANFFAGGTAAKVDITERDLEICAAVGPVLKEKGLLLVGLDVVGGYLTEINVTSPTGVQEINRLNNVCLEAQLWDAMESKLGRSIKP